MQSPAIDDNITPMPVDYLPPLHPHATIVAPDGRFSASDIDDAAARIGAALLEVTGGEDLREARVAFCVAPGLSYVAALRGIWLAGGVAVPLALSHPAAEMDYVIRDAGASAVIADPAFETMLAPVANDAGARYLATSELLAGAKRSVAKALTPTSAPVRRLSPNRAVAERRALIVYTSGTTAKPKGVVTTHANLSAQIGSLVQAWEWTSSDRTLLVLPLHHVHGLINVVSCALTAGATLETLPQFDAAAVWERLASGEITVFTAVPTIYRRLIKAWEAAPADEQRRLSQGSSRARLMMSGSAALPIATLQRWREIAGHTLLERYGMTEIGMALSNPLHGDRHPGCVGAPLPGVETRVVDEAGRHVAAGAAGELEVRGPGVFLEYWQRPDETRRAFRDGWFRTGDVAVVESGVYRLLGRTSIDIIKTGGYKISALEIEEVLRAHPAVADCAIVGVADPEWGERVCAAIELRPEAALTLGDVQEWTKCRLAPYKVPKALCCVDALPRNAMGKVVKPDVKKIFETDRLDA
jgi:malonyl-CoA/methylmalonyl-CoA synthetase